jgi:diguanylate cyclase (GGDEF)-like protein
MMSVMDGPRPGPERLLAVIELQNAIAAAAMNSDEVMRVVVDRAMTMTAASGGSVSLLEADDLVCRAASGSAKASLGSRRPKEGTAAGQCLTERKPIRTERAACVPLLYGEHAVGVLEVAAPKAGEFTDEDLATLPLLAQIVAIALHRAYTYPRPRLDNMHDPVTNLGNRRAFDDCLEAELGRNQRYGHSFSLSMLRLVGLESASDRLGQAAADEMIREVGSILQQHTRAIDALFRLSANEIAVVMPGTSLEGAKVLVDRFRARIDSAGVLDAAVTPSFGVVAAQQKETPAELAGRAYEALDRTR